MSENKFLSFFSTTLDIVFFSSWLMDVGYPHSSPDLTSEEARHTV